ncbi:hypothetical protein [Schaalia sp. Marseille-Q2122]|uniref:hypothetical protein n=1 Tax=Schaalia sp. Marseille-Q2122 TaxID=2736604 RepID=UPI00158E1E47|nr:hypothetical protein [Schaalia sp. Marseille-Q2122]
MTAPDNPMEEPRYGRRSDEWTPEAQTPSSTPSANGTAGTHADTPWPQYGQLSDQTPVSPQPGPNPHGAPYSGQPAPALPGRGRGIGLLVGGLVAMLLVAPAVFFGVLLGGMNLGELANSAAPVQSGQTVTVTDSGSYAVVVNSGDVYGCALTDSAGVSHEMLFQPSTSSTFWAQGLTPGTYTLECATEGNVQLMGMSGLSIDSATSAMLSALGWSALVGFIGLGLTIWGVVAIIRINRQRREIQRTYGIY